MGFWSHVILAAACTVILTQATIFGWLRRGPHVWVGFIHCPLCVGWWVGASFCQSLALSGGPRGFLAITGGGAAAGCLALLFVKVWEKLES